MKKSETRKAALLNVFVCPTVQNPNTLSLQWHKNDIPWHKNDTPSSVVHGHTKKNMCIESAQVFGERWTKCVRLQPMNVCNDAHALCSRATAMNIWRGFMSKSANMSHFYANFGWHIWKNRPNVFETTYQVRPVFGNMCVWMTITRKSLTKGGGTASKFLHPSLSPIILISQQLLNYIVGDLLLF